MPSVPKKLRVMVAPLQGGWSSSLLSAKSDPTQAGPRRPMRIRLLRRRLACHDRAMTDTDTGAPAAEESSAIPNVRIPVLWILGALVGGLILGAMMGNASPLVTESADVVGTVWLNGLRMTVVPLVVALLIVGIVQTAKVARAGRFTAKAVLIMIAILWSSSLIAALVTPLLLEAFPMPREAAQALAAALGQSAPTGDIPPFSEFLRAIVPTNPINSAANDEILPLMIFTLAFAFAVSRLPQKRRRTVSDFFEAIAAAMIILIGWVLMIAPIGVFALALVVGAKAGAAAFGALAHYVLIVTAVGTIVWLLAFVVARVAGRQPLGKFVRAAIPAHAVAISTQSSLASLPAMVEGSKSLGIDERKVDIVLPIAVALFRATGPAMNLAVAIYVAHWLGITLTVPMLAAGVIVAAITTMGAVSLPGSISFISSIAPINLAMGLPVQPLGLLVAVETFPDIMRTVGNVTMDMAVTTTVAAHSPNLKESGHETAPTG